MDRRCPPKSAPSRVKYAIQQNYSGPHEYDTRTVSKSVQPFCTVHVCVQYTQWRRPRGWLEYSLMPHSTQYRSFRRRSSQPITWLILTNKTVQENTDKQTQYKSEKVNNLKYSKTKLPRFSCLLQHSARKRSGPFYNAPEPTRGDADHAFARCNMCEKGPHLYTVRAQQAAPTTRECVCTKKINLEITQRLRS